MALKNLFQPIKIGQLVCKNRLVMSPMCTRLATPEGYVTRELISYYGARARGGTGLITVGYAFIMPRGRSVFSQLAVHDDSCIEGLALLAEEIKLGGSLAFLQICHTGRQTVPSVIGGQQPLAPSAIPSIWMNDMHQKPDLPREMTQDEIEEVIEAFSDAVLRAKKSGFDGVEFHGAVGYLLMSFLSPYSNKRTDWYGGSLENRARLALRVIHRAKEKVGPDYPLMYRFSGDELIEGGFGLDEARLFAKMLEDAGIAAIHVTGTSYDTIHKHEVPLHLPGGNLIHIAAAVKEAVSIPVVGVGSINDPVVADQYIGEGKADMIAMARALLAEPAMARKAEEGRFEDINPCIRCNVGCIEAFFIQTPHHCSVNFVCGRERDFEEIYPAVQKRTVAVIGGGPAGMEAARVAALRGHQVSLFESGPELGGTLLTAALPEFKKGLVRLINYLKHQVEKNGVDIRLKTTATPELLAELKPDVIIMATGARPLSLADVGILGESGVQAEDILAGNPDWSKAIVVGGGLVGTETALWLAKRGCNVTLMEKEHEIGRDVELLTIVSLKEEMAKYKVNIMTDTSVMMVTADGVVFWQDGRRETLAADGVVLALGYKPECENQQAFKRLAKQFYVVGDARKAAKIMEAIHSGFYAAYHIR